MCRTASATGLTGGMISPRVRLLRSQSNSNECSRSPDHIPEPKIGEVSDTPNEQQKLVCPLLLGQQALTVYTSMTALCQERTLTTLNIFVGHCRNFEACACFQNVWHQVLTIRVRAKRDI
jgi:hypothetical protein